MQLTAFHRLAIVNRGEAAVRILHAVHEIRTESGADIATIALYTEPDTHSIFVREADESFALGPATFTDPRNGQQRCKYYNYNSLEQAIRATRVDAVWAGWGLVAEQPEFADLCDRLGIVFVGPPGDVMRRVGNRVACKLLAQDAGLLVVPWSNGPVATLAEARDHARRLGYPVMIKAAAVGGHRGAHDVTSESDLAYAFENAREDALRAFGDATVLVEKRIVGARHMGVQVVSDAYGTTWCVGVHDRTIQRRNRTVIAETPSPSLDAATESALRAAAVKLANAAGFRNVGSVDCFFDPMSHQFFIAGMDTCLQLDHPVSEAVTGLDLVKLQLHVAAGGRLEGVPPATNGHAIQVRLSAEDPYDGFTPALGTIALFRIPTGPGVRVDTGVREGDDISSEIGPTIAKITAHGRNRKEAISRLRRALLDCTVVAQSGTTNKALLLQLLDHDDFVQNNYDVDWLDHIWKTSNSEIRPFAHVALISTAIHRYEEAFQHSQKLFFASAARGRPHVDSAIGITVELQYAGQLYRMSVRRIGLSQYRVTTSEGSLDARLDRQGPFETWLTFAGRRHRIVSIANGLRHLVEVDGVPHRVSRDEYGVVRAPAPAVTLAICCRVGDEVLLGDRLIVLEAMKMEMGVAAPCSGRVREVVVMQNTQVQLGEALVVIEPFAESMRVPGGPRVTFPSDLPIACATAPVEASAFLIGELLRAVQGFDVSDQELRDNAAKRAQICATLPPDDETLWHLENEVLQAFADISRLFRRDANPLTGTPNADELLRTYLRAVESEGRGLPQAFLARLRAVLAHYGVDDLARTPQLEEVLVCLYKSQRRVKVVADQVFGLLERRLQYADGLRAMGTPAFREILDRLIDATLGRDLGLNDLAREVRYRFFDRPLFDATRDDVYKGVARSLAVLREGNDEPARQEAMRALVACPQQLAGYLARNWANPDAKEREIALSVMLRRVCGANLTGDIEVRLVDGRHVANAAFQLRGRQCFAIATHAVCADLRAAILAASSVADTLRGAQDVGLEVLTESERDPTDLDSALARIQEAMKGVTFSQSVRRVVVAFVSLDHWRAVNYFTFDVKGSEYTERVVHRGIHPMLADRLELWRLSNFNTRQLRASDDVYLFHAVARDNPKDERLFAFAEVRDLSAVRDASGQILQLPHLERMYTEALAGIRDFQLHRSARDRLYWNRIILYIWPDAGLSLRDIGRVAARLAPLANGLGMEKAVLRVRLPEGDSTREAVLHISNRIGTGMHLRFDSLSSEPIRSLSAYAQKVVRMRRLGLVYPYEIIRMLTTPGAEEAEFPHGDFVEYDITDGQNLVPVDRPAGENKANVIVGVLTNYTEKHPEGLKRVGILGDPSREMGALAEPECRRIIGAIKLAAKLQVPVEWYAVSSGAKISMDVGTEGLDWIALVLRSIIEFTQVGGEINVVVLGVNVGGQSYWNAEATMLMHTRGVLIMTEQGSMVLTGKRALEYSGGVSADDNQGIGGADGIMEPNGQAQYVVSDLAEACHILFRHYDYTYVVPGERFPRRRATSDQASRDVCLEVHLPVNGIPFQTVGDVFSCETNPGRKKPFDIRSLMRAVADKDDEPLERWARMRDAENAVVWDAYVGGVSVCMIGVESRPLARLGFVPADGPDTWTGGTLFPLSSKKVARAINASSNNRPVVVLANLSGFDGSPESMRKLQLEYGSEIGRAIVNFNGPIVFCVISRYHGGAYVVFSRALNDGIEAVAIAGSHASVIGGAPASAVVFPAEVKARALADQRVRNVQEELSAALSGERVRARARYDEVFRSVYAEKQGEVALEFDSVHSVERARDVGSLQHIIAASSLRPYLIEAIERGLARELFST